MPVRFLCSVLLIFAHSVLSGQFPAYRHEVIDYNRSPQLRSHFDVPNFYPGKLPGTFFFSFHNLNPNGVFHFDGRQLDTVVANGSINGQISGEYAGGMLLYRNEGTRETQATYHLDPRTYDTVFLSRSWLRDVHTFADGRRLLNDNYDRLYVIGDSPGSLERLPLGLDRLSGRYLRLKDRFIYTTQNGVASTDGTLAGTQLVYENRSSVTQMVAGADRIYFATYGRELYVTDGTAAGTRPITFDHLPEAERPEYAATELFAVDGGLLFRGYMPDDEQKFWRTDGTPAGTYAIASATVGPSAHTDSLFLFRAGAPDAPQVWATTGDTADTRLLVDLSEREVANARWGVHLIAELDDGTVYFRTDEQLGDDSFYRLAPDGTVRRTVLPVDDRAPAPLFLATASQLFVIDRGSRSGLYLHRPGEDQLDRLASFGQAVGSVRLDDGGIVVFGAADFASSDNQDVTVVYYRDSVRIFPTFQSVRGDYHWPALGFGALVQDGDRLVGIGIDETVGEAILSFDLLTGDTKVYHDLYPYTKDAAPGGLRAGGEVAYFVHENVVYGSVAGCQYEPLFPGDPHLRVSTLAGTNRSLVYGSRNNDNYYFTDGTRAGTVILPTPVYPAASPVQAFGNHFYYLSGQDGTTTTPGAYRLVRLDGTTGKATVVHSLSIGRRPVPAGYWLQPGIASTGTAMYFPLYNGSDWELWRSDGTPAGTSHHLSLSTLGDNLFPFDLTGSHGVVHFIPAASHSGLHEADAFLMREGETQPVRIQATDSYYRPTPVRINKRTYYTDGDTLFALPDGSLKPQVVLVHESGIQELTAANDSTLLFTTISYFDAALWKVHLPTGTLTRLLDDLPQRHPDPGAQLPLLDSLVLIAQRAGVYTRPRLVNVRTGEALDDDGYRERDVSTVVTAGNRFLYISDGWVYGREVYVLNFGEHTVNPPTKVADAPATTGPVPVYPNPVASGAEIHLRLPVAARYAYRMYGADGQLRRSGSFTEAIATITTEGLFPGVYIVRIQEARSRRVYSARLIIVGK